jgi:hypothetical protein
MATQRHLLTRCVAFAAVTSISLAGCHAKSTAGVAGPSPTPHATSFPTDITVYTGDGITTDTVGAGSVRRVFGQRRLDQLMPTIERDYADLKTNPALDATSEYTPADFDFLADILTSRAYAVAQQRFLPHVATAATATRYLAADELPGLGGELGLLQEHLLTSEHIASHHTQPVPTYYGPARLTLVGTGGARRVKALFDVNQVIPVTNTRTGKAGAIRFQSAVVFWLTPNPDPAGYWDLDDLKTVSGFSRFHPGHAATGPYVAFYTLTACGSHAYYHHNTVERCDNAAHGVLAGATRREP